MKPGPNRRDSDCATRGADCKPSRQHHPPFLLDEVLDTLHPGQSVCASAQVFVQVANNVSSRKQHGRDAKESERWKGRKEGRKKERKEGGKEGRWQAQLEGEHQGTSG